MHLSWFVVCWISSFAGVVGDFWCGGRFGFLCFLVGRRVGVGLD